MKIIKKDLKNGRIVLRLEVADDLYYLAEVISRGDIVISKTKRRIDIERGLHKADRLEKVTVTLGIEVENVEFDQNVERLRITGKIVRAPEDIPTGHHTLNLKPGMVLTVEKKLWSNSDLVKIQDSTKTINAKILLAAIEDGNCSLGFLRNYGIQKLGTISVSISGKDDLDLRTSETKKFFREVLDAMKKETEVQRIIVAGPGFTKDSFFKFAKESEKEFSKKILVESVSSGGEKGLQEIVKRGIIQRVVKESKIQLEVEALSKFFEELNKDTGLAAYGFEEVQNACSMGAVEKLFVSNSFLRKSKAEKNTEIESLIRTAGDMKGGIILVSSEHELGKQLEGLGGVAAFLRYKIKYE